MSLDLTIDVCRLTGPSGHLVRVAEAPAAVHEEARVVDHLLRPALAGFQRRQREERLVGGADRVGAAQRPRFSSGFPGRRSLVPDLGIECRFGPKGRCPRSAGDEARTSAGRRFDGDQRAAAVLEGALESPPLQGRMIRSQPQVLPATGGVSVSVRTARPPAVISTSCTPVVRAARAGSSPRCRSCRCTRCRRSCRRRPGLDAAPCRLRNPADVADHVAARPLPSGIVAEQPRAQLDAGKPVALGG